MPEKEFFGYNGKILRVNLTDGTVKTESIDEPTVGLLFQMRVSSDQEVSSTS